MNAQVPCQVVDPTAPSSLDTGSISAFAVVAVTMLLIFVGIAVDLSGALHAGQRAQDVARQAARSGAEAARGSTAINGRAASIDPARAASTARAYLAASGVRGTVSTDGSAVSVVTSDTYQSAVLGLVGIDSIHVSGSSTATLTRVLTGATR